jgi:hypothetical protein
VWQLRNAALERVFPPHVAGGVIDPSLLSERAERTEGGAMWPYADAARAGRRGGASSPALKAICLLFIYMFDT